MNSPDLSKLDPYLILDTRVVKKNYLVYKEKYPNAEISGVLKANAYGIGEVEIIANLLNSLGCNSFFVGNIDEAIKIRKNLKNAKIYILFSSMCRDAFFDYFKNDFIPVINSVENLEKVAENARKFLQGLNQSNLSKEDAPLIFKEMKYRVCIKIDSGMNRLGIKKEDLVKKSFYGMESLIIDSVITRLACDREESESNEEQLKEFNDICNQYFPDVKRSISATNMLCQNEKFVQDMIRVGSGLYGLTEEKIAQEVGLQLAIAIKARIIKIFNVKPGEKVGYGQTFKVEKPMTLATVNFGFSHGLPVRINDFYFKFNNKKMKIVGVVSMNLSVIDLSEINENELKQIDCVDVISDREHLQDFLNLSGLSILDAFCKFGLGISQKIVLK